MMKGLEDMTYEKWLRIIGLFSSEERRLRGSLIAVYNFFMKGSRKEGADLFSLVSGDRTQGNGLKLHQGKFRWETRKSRKLSSLRRWSSTRTSSPGEWSWPQDCWCSRAS